MPPLTSSPPLLSRLYLSVLCNKIIKEDSALHCGRQRSPKTLETRILQTTARWTGNRGTTVLTESLLLPHGGAESLARCCYNNINNNSTDVTAFLLLVVWFGPKCTLVDQKMSLLPGTKDITPGDPMADYVNALKAWDRDAHDQYFVRFHDDPGPSQVMLAEEFYATDVDGVPGSCCLQSHVREGIFRDADMSRDDDFQES